LLPRTKQCPGPDSENPVSFPSGNDQRKRQTDPSHEQKPLFWSRNQHSITVQVDAELITSERQHKMVMTLRRKTIRQPGKSADSLPKTTGQLRVLLQHAMVPGNPLINELRSARSLGKTPLLTNTTPMDFRGFFKFNMEDAVHGKEESKTCYTSLSATKIKSN